MIPSNVSTVLISEHPLTTAGTGTPFSIAPLSFQVTNIEVKSSVGNAP